MGVVLQFESSLKHELKDLLDRSLRQFLGKVLSDDLIHAETLALGQEEFRRRFVKDLGPVFEGKSQAPADDLANSVWHFLRTQWGQAWPGTTPQSWLNGYQPPPPPLTREDLLADPNWEVTIGSDEKYVERMWEGSARERKGPLTDLLGAKRKDPEAADES